MIFGFSVFSETCFSDFIQTNPNTPEEHWDAVCQTNSAFVDGNINVSSWASQNSAVSSFLAVSVSVSSFASVATSSSSWNESSSSIDQVHDSC